MRGCLKTKVERQSLFFADYLIHDERSFTQMVQALLNREKFPPRCMQARSARSATDWQILLGEHKLIPDPSIVKIREKWHTAVTRMTRRISLKRKDHALCQGIKHDQNSAENTYPQVDINEVETCITLRRNRQNHRLNCDDVWCNTTVINDL